MEVNGKYVRDLRRGLFFFWKERGGILTRGKTILGLILIGLAVFGMFSRQDKTEVLVLKENAERGTRITENMLTTRELEPDEAYIPLEEREKIIGKETVGFLRKGTPLFPEYFREAELTPNEKEGRYGMCIPAGWIVSKPAGMTRGDRVFFYQGRREITSALVYAAEQDSVEIIVSKEQAAQLCEATDGGKQLAMIYQ